LIKIIFLDVDGVLNSSNFFRESRKKTYDTSNLDKKAVEVLNTIIELTGAKVVISSTWRVHDFFGLLCELGENDFKGEVIGQTPILNQSIRGNEIKEWIQLNKESLDVTDEKDFKNYLILDDNSDMFPWQKDNFVQTETEIGLTKEHIDRCVKILNK
jgi:hypothetical protein